MMHDAAPAPILYLISVDFEVQTEAQNGSKKGSEMTSKTSSEKSTKKRGNDAPDPHFWWGLKLSMYEYI